MGAAREEGNIDCWWEKNVLNDKKIMPELEMDVRVHWRICVLGETSKSPAEWDPSPLME